ncbi:MAG: putative Modification methylase, HemK family [Candidatus Saccharibacteria bacterium]|nr:putative Modification methylase, HemK family [Candidatus Saccharibacteria bacterium]
MNVKNWLEEAILRLERADIATARLDCLVLLEDAIGINRANILAHPEREITDEQLKELASKLVRREAHQPLAYIRGKTEFYGREFIITPAVLEPRPESETMIELLLELDLPEKPHIVDVGTGSGALGITAKLEIPDAVVALVDIDAAALGIARKNTRKHGLELSCVTDNLLERAQRPIDIILANLPYVPDSYQINTAAHNEPRIAIFGGEDGLDLYRTMFTQIDTKESKPKFILTESLPMQHSALADIATSHGYALKTSSDFIQLFTLK